MNTIPIAAARAAAEGTKVTVEGIVTVAPGTLGPGFALQDDSGGMLMTGTGGGPGPARGQRLHVTGQRAAQDGQAVLQPSAITAIGHGVEPAPVARATGALDAALEGRLARVQGRVTAVTPDLPWGWKLMLDDGSGALLIFIVPVTHIDAAALHAGDTLRVTGYTGRYGDHLELLPREAADMHKISGAP